MLIDSFLDYLRLERNYSQRTIESYSGDLVRFEAFFKSLDCNLDWSNVDKDVVRRWIVELMDKGGKPTSVNRRISALRSFFKYLLMQKVVTVSPMAMVTGPKKPKPLPYYIKESEVNRLLDEVPLGNDYVGVRDKLAIEMLYVTGLRASELSGLDVADVDFSAKQLKVTGKRNKQRMVPFGDRLCESLKNYLTVRACFCTDDSEEALLLNSRGGRMSRIVLTKMVNDRLSLVSSAKKKSAHTLRHTFATTMLNHEADLSCIKEILGHESLATTEIYTHTTFEELKKVYNKAHPRA